MAHSQNLFSLQSQAYKQYRPQYPDELFQYLAKLAPSNHLAWDCGCGNGQATIALAQYFQRVEATDISAEQIAAAESAANVSYRVCAAEKIQAHNNSVDLVIVAQAIHWFKHDQFFAEVNRVLKPGGILAVWGYMLFRSDSPIDAHIAKLHGETVGAYWPKGRELLDAGYRHIPFPYPHLDTPSFTLRCRWQFPQVIGYLNTWSAVKAYHQAHGVNPVAAIYEELLSAWGGETVAREVYWPLVTYLGRKAK